MSISEVLTSPWELQRSLGASALNPPAGIFWTAFLQKLQPDQDLTCVLPLLCDQRELNIHWTDVTTRALPQGPKERLASLGWRGSRAVPERRRDRSRRDIPALFVQEHRQEQRRGPRRQNRCSGTRKKKGSRTQGHKRDKWCWSEGQGPLGIGKSGAEG